MCPLYLEQFETLNFSVPATLNKVRGSGESVSASSRGTFQCRDVKFLLSIMLRSEFEAVTKSSNCAKKMR